MKAAVFLGPQQDLTIEDIEMDAPRPHEVVVRTVASGVCRVRGEPWVLLAAADGLDRRIDVIADALKTHAGAALEGRYLPPAVRARLSQGSEVG